MEFWTITSIVASIVSLFIGGFAIWLSFTFYKMSNKVSEETKEAAKAINSSVERLETIFEKLFYDSFGMMKNNSPEMSKPALTKTYSIEDMGEKVEQKTAQKITTLRKELNDELSEVIKKNGSTKEKVDSYKDLSEIIDKAIAQTRKVETETKKEAIEATILNEILSTIQQELPMTLNQVVSLNALNEEHSKQTIIKCLKRFVKDKIIAIEGNFQEPSSVLKLV